LDQARDSLTQFRETWAAGHPPEIAAAHLQDAVLPLEEMLGVITNEDVLDVLFGDFCVGK
jgi:tRNA U34 5-carboxymethylaminomethyl modifying GTPase MnmE/TrmE